MGNGSTEIHEAHSAPYFLGDPVLDDLLDICLQLAGELWATKARLNRLEALIEVDGRTAAQVLEEQVADEDPEGYEVERDQFVERVFAALQRRGRVGVDGAV